LLGFSYCVSEVPDQYASSFSLSEGSGRSWHYWVQLGPIVGVLAPPADFRQRKFDELHPQVCQQVQAEDDDQQQSSVA
jgi:hypothetical protein